MRHTHTACWITKATDTHSEYVTLVAFPRQHWLYELPSMLRYACIARLGLDFKMLTVLGHVLDN